jgi:tetratricopeptide (TPR) repeat protein
LETAAWSQAYQELRRTVALEPHNLGWAYYQKGAYQSAVDLLLEAEKMGPQDPGIHYHLGLAYYRLGDETRARNELERALRISPDYPRSGEIRQVLSQLRRS